MFRPELFLCVRNFVAERSVCHTADETGLCTKSYSSLEISIPVWLSLSPDGQPMLLPPGQVQEMNRRSTGMLSSVQRFFAHHLIEAFGCDYSTSGVTLEALTAKIKSFLELRTADGPRHDTYVIFYSGHSHRSGEWALSGKREPEQDGKCPLLALIFR